MLSDGAMRHLTDAERLRRIDGKIARQRALLVFERLWHAAQWLLLAVGITFARVASGLLLKLPQLLQAAALAACVLACLAALLPVARMRWPTTREAMRHIENGGRYDDIGRVFGRARPATGFSFDLKTLLGLLPAAGAAPRRGVFVDHALAEAAWSEIQRLRDGGERVLLGLPGQRGSACCDRELRRAGDAWQILTV